MSIHKKINKSISWSITKNCNYNCDYCISADRKFRKDKYPEPYSFLRGFKKYLKGSWIFYICGSGEPFLTPRFLDIIKELVKNNHKLVIITNFSASVETLIHFSKIAGNNLIHLAASFHPDFKKDEVFLKKAIIINKILGNKRFSVRVVVKKRKLIYLTNLGKKLKKNNISFFLKPMRINDENTYTQKTIDYNKKEWDLIKRFPLHNDENLSNINCYKGKKCWAGSMYFIIDEKGDAWRCYPAQKMRLSKDYLGNLINENFKLRNKATECLY